MTGKRGWLRLLRVSLSVGVILGLGFQYLLGGYMSKQLFHDPPPNATMPVLVSDKAKVWVGNRLQKERAIVSATTNQSLLALVTGFSENHFLEGVNMLRSLMSVNYEGPLSVYLLRRKGEALSVQMTELRDLVLSSSNLVAEVVEYEETEPYETYCFKPRLLKDFMVRHALEMPKVLMWADSSIRFLENPQLFAKRMMTDGIYFSGRTGWCGVSENTHPTTYKYLNVPPLEYKDYIEIEGGLFLVQIHPSVLEGVMYPWIECGTQACRSCMAPPGASLQPPNGTSFSGVGSTTYVASKFDQSVLSVLVYEWMFKHNGSTHLYYSRDEEANRYYMNVRVKREDRAISVKDLNVALPKGVLGCYHHRPEDHPCRQDLSLFARFFG